MTMKTPPNWVYENDEDRSASCYEDEIARLTRENEELRTLLQECSDALGIRDDFVPLGPAIDLAPKISKALATLDVEEKM